MKKIISSILAASFIASMCVINVMAAEPTTRTMTVDASAKTDVAAGDSIVVTVALSDNLSIDSCGYKLNYDPAIFEIDTTQSGRNPKNYIDATWYKNLTDSNGAWGWYLNSTSVAEGTNGSMNTIVFTSYGSSGIDAADRATDCVIGKYTLKVKEGVTASSATLTLTEASTKIFGVNTEDTITVVPVTVNFKSDEPTVTPWEVTITKDTENAKGYIWKVDTAKGDGNLTKFDVTFKDTASNELTRSIIASDKGGALNWNAATSFYVGLYTTRTGVTADWDIAAKDGDKDVPVTLK